MTMRYRLSAGALLALVLTTALAPWQSASGKSWNATSGDWSADGNWSPVGVPTAGEAVTVSVGNAVISLTNETALLGSFTMSSGRLVFSNWTTRLMATNITISGGTVTVANAFSDVDMSNRVWLVCSNDFTLTSSGRIDVANMGYLAGYGPGRGTPQAISQYGGGAGHGGKGGVGYFDNGPVTDNLYDPTEPGSGGGCTNQGGNGGGAVRIEAGGMATLGAPILANGQTGLNQYGGGGAGGSISITAASFAAGTNGQLQANGGAQGNYRCGSGGGGRIALPGGTVPNPFAVRFSTAPGATSTSTTGVTPFGSTINNWADWGTVYIADSSFIASMPVVNQFTKSQLQIGSVTSWTTNQLTVISNSFRLLPDGFQLNVGGNLTVATNAELGVRGSISVGGDLVLTNNGVLSVYSGPTNASVNYGSLVSVSGDVAIVGNNCWIRPYADPTNGGGVLFRMRNLTVVQTNAGINACGTGFAPGQGPGAGAPNAGNAGGGGYGGRGSSTGGAGQTNGNPYAPIFPGSGGGLHTSLNISNGAGYGGGSIRVEAIRTVSIKGRLMAQGGQGFTTSQYGAGGAGGGIFIACSNFEGFADSILDVKGGNSGNGNSGGGGGGRIAVWYGRIVPERRAQLLAGNAEDALLTNSIDSHIGSMNISTGAGMQSTAVAESGTVWFITFPTGRPPEVSVTSPIDGAILATNSFAVEVQAFSDTYTVTQVVVFADNAELGVVTTAPFAVSWNAAPWGAHTLHAVAYDSAGQRSTSETARVMVSHGVKTWAAVGTGDWFQADSWIPAGVPESWDYVTVASGVVMLTNETALLTHFQMNAGRLVFSNWTTRVRALSAYVAGGTVTVANAFSDLDMSNRVWIVCSNDFTLTAPGRVDVSSLGYASYSGPGRGVPETGSYAGGGGHGGKGGVGYYNGGPATDSLMEPTEAGSGGGYTNLGGSGGGVIRIEAGGTLAVNGSVLANGQSAPQNYGGGGAGGTICLVADFFTGNTNGLLQANGGIGGHATFSGGGGGGRIAVLGGAVSTPLMVRFSTAPGAPSINQTGVLPYGSAVNTWAEWGTVYIADTNLLAGMPQDNQFNKTVLQIGTATNWDVGGLVLTNNSFRLIPDGFQLNVAGDLVIDQNGDLGVRGSIACGGNLVLTNNGRLSVYSGPTNDAVSCGALVEAGGDLLITGTNAWFFPNSDYTNGGSVLIRARSLMVTETNAGINASGRGFGPGQGPGKGAPSGQYSGGAWHGGSGQKGTSLSGASGTINGNPYAPAWPGSGGGLRTNSPTLSGGTGYGGGLIRVEASNAVVVAGQIVAQGGQGRGATTYGAGGAGGGIWIVCQAFTGTATAVLAADGGNGGIINAGSAGGGRIAVWQGRPMPELMRQALQAGVLPRSVQTNLASGFAGTVSVTNGTYGSVLPYPTPGTVFFLQYVPRTGALLMIR